MEIATYTQYGLVVYHAADHLPHPSSDSYGPFSNPQRIPQMLERIDSTAEDGEIEVRISVGLVGGRGESHANVAEGLATALQCFEDMQARREPNTVPQKHCILVCSSPPYLMPVMESHNYAGHTVDQLAATLQERGIHLSILCPRKIPSLFKLYDKAGGDLQASLIKNYAKDPRHLVLLKGYRSDLSVHTNSGLIGPQPQAPGSVSMTSLPSPQTNLGSPMSVVAGVGPTQTPQALINQQGPTPQVSTGAVYRPNQNQVQPIMMPQQQQQQQQQQMINNISRVGPPYNQQNPPGYPTGPGITWYSQQQQQQQQQMINNISRVGPPYNQQNPPGYPTGPGISRQPARWPMLPPQQRAPYIPIQPGTQNNPTQGSALIAQLTQPPAQSINPVVLNQYTQRLDSNKDQPVITVQSVIYSVLSNKGRDSRLVVWAIVRENFISVTCPRDYSLGVSTQVSTLLVTMGGILPVYGVDFSWVPVSGSTTGTAPLLIGMNPSATNTNLLNIAREVVFQNLETEDIEEVVDVEIEELTKEELQELALNLTAKRTSLHAHLLRRAWLLHFTAFKKDFRYSSNGNLMNQQALLMNRIGPQTPVGSMNIGGPQGAQAQQSPGPVSQQSQSSGPAQSQNVGSQSQSTPPGPIQTTPGQTPQVGQPSVNTAPIGGTFPRERHTIWQGVLEWIEKAKNPTDPQKVTRHVPCQVSANLKDGEPELKADTWPQKLIMQLMPKQLIGNIGGAYLKNSKSVLFHPQNCEALDSLTRVMSSGFAGCVHFTSVPVPSPCEIKVLILLYTSEKRAYLGFIPNDQAAFVDRLRKVIQHQKTTQALMRQTQVSNTSVTPGPGVSMNPQGQGPQTSQANQSQQGGILMSQTNTMAMGGGQITQNVVNPGGIGQQGSGAANSQNSQGQQISGLQQSNDRQQQQPSSAGGGGGGGNLNRTQGMMSSGPQRPQFDHIEAARQQNLAKIQQLRQTLEAAQQQELQYKSQLEIYNHMKIQQLQQNLEVAQQQEMQYKAQMEQEQQKMLRAQLQQMTQQQQRQMTPQGMQNTQQQQSNQQQQRMMRPQLANNPGLRHLLQQYNSPTIDMWSSIAKQDYMSEYQIHSVVSDNARNITLAPQQAKENHVPCAAHTPQRVVHHALLNQPSVNDMCARTSDVSSP
uniref:Mediator of RNA polymerase II transcription subunit 25 n=2 Tax=Timema TaxID=61471 RepID=A0A7R9J8D3_TIMCA|nr:unnamed protein product [Timema californicum]